MSNFLCIAESAVRICYEHSSLFYAKQAVVYQQVAANQIMPAEQEITSTISHGAFQRY